ncbi:hypothetical protein U1Q18_023965 [Sarracenia purpurea var. burkii]
MAALMEAGCLIDMDGCMLEAGGWRLYAGAFAVFDGCLAKVSNAASSVTKKFKDNDLVDIDGLEFEDTTSSQANSPKGAAND